MKLTKNEVVHILLALQVSYILNKYDVSILASVTVLLTMFIFGNDLTFMVDWFSGKKNDSENKIVGDLVD